MTKAPDREGFKETKNPVAVELIVTEASSLSGLKETEAPTSGGHSALKVTFPDQSNTSRLYEFDKYHSIYIVLNRFAEEIWWCAQKYGIENNIFVLNA